MSYERTGKICGATCTCLACGPIIIGQPHPQTGNPVQSRLSAGSEADFILEGTKSSLKGTLVKHEYLENPGHHDPTQPLKYDSDKSVLPPNSIDLFESSVEVGSVRYAVDKDCEIHQFQQSSPGVFHWAGATNGVTKSGQPRSIEIASGVKRQLFAN